MYMYLSIEDGGKGMRDLVSHLEGKLGKNDGVWNTNMTTVQVHLNDISLGGREGGEQNQRHMKERE